MKFLRLLFGILFVSFCSNLFASVSVEIDGVRYECTASQGGQDTQCWDHCPWDFGNCAKQCGAGQGCWKKCTWDFTQCQLTCGQASAPSFSEFELSRRFPNPGGRILGKNSQSTQSKVTLNLDVAP